MWTSSDSPQDALTGVASKYEVPVIANGYVYVSTGTGIEIYGLTPPPSVAPQTPILSGSVASDTAVVLNWVDSSSLPNTATGYTIESSTDGVDWTVVQTAPAGATSASIGGLQVGIVYSFQILGFNNVGNSSWSNTVNLTPAAPPSNVQAVAGNGLVSLSWDVGTGATTFMVYRGTSASNITTLLTPTPIATTSFTDSTATDNTNWSYVVYGVTSTGLSAPSTVVTAVPYVTGDVVTGLIHNYLLASDATDSIGGDDGTTVNGPTIANGSASFNGINQAVVVPDAADMEFTSTDSYTLSAWVNVTSLTGNWAGIVTHSRDDPPWYGIWLDPGGDWTFGGSTGNVASTNTVVPGVWYLVTPVQDGVGGTRSLYVDGDLVATGTAADASGSGALYIGGSGVGEYLDGSVGDVRLYNVALSSAQIGSVYSATSPSHQGNTFSSPDNTTFVVGTPNSFSVETGQGTNTGVTFSESGPLPSGVTFTSAGVLAGAPVTGSGGSWFFTIDASTNGGSPAYQTFALTVDQAPEIISANNVSFTVGMADSFAVATAAGTFPTATTFSETGDLPPA